MNMQYSIGIRGLACKVLKLGQIKVNSDLFLTASSRGPNPFFKRESVSSIGTRPSPSQPSPLVTHPSLSRPSTIIKGLLCRVHGLEGNSVWLSQIACSTQLMVAESATESWVFKPCWHHGNWPQKPVKPISSLLWAKTTKSLPRIVGVKVLPDEWWWLCNDY